MNMNMKVKTESLAVTASIMAAAIFTLCTVILAVFPDAIKRIWSNAWHVGFGKAFGNLTLTSYVLGLCLWAVSAFVVFAIAGGIYNWLSSGKAIPAVLQSRPGPHPELGPTRGT